MAKSLLEHDRVGGLHAVDHPAQIHIQNAIPIIEFVQPRFTADADSSVVKDVVEAFFAKKRALNETIHCQEVSDI